MNTVTFPQKQVLMEHYCELRRQAITGYDCGSSRGMALFHSRGMIAWIMVIKRILSSQKSAIVEYKEASCVDKRCSNREIVGILASLALEVFPVIADECQEVYSC